MSFTFIISIQSLELKSHVVLKLPPKFFNSSNTNPCQCIFLKISPL